MTPQQALAATCKHERPFFDHSSGLGVSVHCSCGKVRTYPQRDVRKAKIAFYQQQTDLNRVGFEVANGPTFRRLRAKLESDKGFTFNPRTGLYVESGFAVSIFKERERVTDSKQFSETTIAEFYRDNLPILIKPCHYFGAWDDVANRQIYLDIIVLKDSESEAREVAKAHNQLAFYCLHEAREVRV